MSIFHYETVHTLLFKNISVLIRTTYFGLNVCTLFKHVSHLGKRACFCVKKRAKLVFPFSSYNKCVVHLEWECNRKIINDVEINLR